MRSNTFTLWWTLELSVLWTRRACERCALGITSFTSAGLSQPMRRTARYLLDSRFEETRNFRGEFVCPAFGAAHVALSVRLITKGCGAGSRDSCSPWIRRSRVAFL